MSLPSGGGILAPDTRDRRRRGAVAPRPSKCNQGPEKASSSALYGHRGSQSGDGPQSAVIERRTPSARCPRQKPMAPISSLKRASPSFIRRSSKVVGPMSRYRTPRPL